MKKDKISAIIVFLAVIFIVFVFGLFVGKKLSLKSSKEGVVKESSLKSKNSQSGILNAGGHKIISPGSIKFAPISKLAALKKESVQPVKEPAVAPIKNKIVKKPKAKVKIIYVKKPVYVYKYITKKIPVKGSPSSPFNSKVYYAVQVAAFSNYAQAKVMADKLNSMGFFAYIIPITVKGKEGNAVYQQVRVGKFSAESGAKSIENIIAKKFNVKPYIIKID